MHPRFGTPALAVATSAVWATVLALSGTFEQLFTYVVFASWIFAALAAASVFVLRRRRPDAPRPFRVPGYPVTPALFIAAATAIVLNTVVARDCLRTRPSSSEFATMTTSSPSSSAMIASGERNRVRWKTSGNR